VISLELIGHWLRRRQRLHEGAQIIDMNIAVDDDAGLTIHLPSTSKTWSPCDFSR
jgi:hypothetical protein